MDFIIDKIFFFFYLSTDSILFSLMQLFLLYIISKELNTFNYTLIYFSMLIVLFNNIDLWI